MSRISTRLAGPALLSNAAATKITVAASELVIVRHLRVVNPTNATVNFTASIGADAAGTRIFDAQPIPALGGQSFYGPYTMTAAEILQAFGSVNNALVLTIDGERSVLG